MDAKHKHFILKFTMKFNALTDVCNFIRSVYESTMRVANIASGEIRTKHKLKLSKKSK